MGGSGAQGRARGEAGEEGRPGEEGGGEHGLSWGREKVRGAQSREQREHKAKPKPGLVYISIEI